MGNSGLRSKRAWTARMAALISEMPFSLGFATEFGDGLHAPPGRTLSPLQHGFDIDQLGAIPVLL